MRQLINSIAVILLATACSNVPEPTAPPATPEPVNQHALKAHVEFLASDLLAGRDTGSDEYLIAANYVAAHFQSLDLTPAGDDGRYFQNVPLVITRLEQSSPTMTIDVAGQTTRLDYPNDFLSSSDPLRTTSSVTAELVFVGYGIVSEQMNHDDYQGLDVTDKIVVMLTGRPEQWPSEAGAHLSSQTNKAKTAATHGAVGIIRLHTTKEEEIDPYVKNLDYLEVPRMSWVGADGRIAGHVPEIISNVYVRPEAAGAIFQGAPVTLAALLQADLDGDAITGFPLNASVTLSFKSRHDRTSSPNVIGILKGTDPVLKNEYLVYTAHLDHIGIIKNQAGVAEIHPGAMDNATGVALMLETARVLTTEKSGLKRSIIFIALTGEEKGLRGAGYFANYPTVPIESIVANINLDMPYLGYQFKDVVAFGAEHSSLKDVVAAAASQAGLTLSPDQMPQEAIFVRSDHYRFVQQGIPAVMLSTGFTAADPGIDGGKLFRSFLKNRYHRPGDNLEQTIDYEAAAAFAEVNINIGRIAGNDTNRPKWNKNDFFGDLFAQ